MTTKSIETAGMTHVRLTTRGPWYAERRIRHPRPAVLAGRRQAVRP